MATVEKKAIQYASTMGGAIVNASLHLGVGLFLGTSIEMIIGELDDASDANAMLLLELAVQTALNGVALYGLSNVYAGDMIRAFAFSTALIDAQPTLSKRIRTASSKVRNQLHAGLRQMGPLFPAADSPNQEM